MPPILPSAQKKPAASLAPPIPPRPPRPARPLPKPKVEWAKDVVEVNPEDTVSKKMTGYMASYFDDHAQEVTNASLKAMFNATDSLFMQRSRMHRADWPVLVRVLEQKREQFCKRKKGLLTRTKTEKSHQEKIVRRLNWYINLASAVAQARYDVRAIAHAHPLALLGSTASMKIFIADLEVLMRLGEASFSTKEWGALRGYLAEAVTQMIRPIADQPMDKIKDVLDDGIQCIPPKKHEEASLIWGDAYNLARVLQNWSRNAHGRFETFLAWDRRERPYDW